MAVAGGALLTAAAGLIGTLAVLRFGLVGLGLRAAFAVSDLIGVGRAFGGLSRLAPFALSGLLKPVKWGAKLIGRIPWVRLAGTLALNTLVIPLKWTAALLPNFAPALRRFRAFRIAASAQMTRLLAAVSWRMVAMSGVAAGVFAAIYPTAANTGPNGESEHDLVQREGQSWWAMPPEERQAIVDREEAVIRAKRAAQGAVGDPMAGPGEDILRSGPPSRPKLRPPQSAAVGTSLRPVARPSQDARDLAALNASAEAVERINGLVSEGTLPTERRLERMASRVGEIRSEVEAMEASLASLSPDQSQGGQGDALRMQLEEKRATLQQMEADLASVGARAVALETELQRVHGTEIAPVINTESIDRARQAVGELALQLRALPSGGAGAAPAVKPAGARADGGPVRMGLPYLVNERTPRSEWFGPSRSGGILNVSQAQSAFRSHLASVGPRPGRRPSSVDAFAASASRVRAASYAALTAAAASVAVPAAAQPAQAGKPGAGAVTVQIENFTVQVPSGVSDPDAIADLVADRIGQRVEATMSASFSD
ncbi:hypothetical protein [Ponticoccus alexandrii]|uniref:Phage tail tape measure protein n=1 Tax=Ponticoccus alexandrii TaxID=1943633 RepID=A0ABX7F7S2_9RHOB|nr:hypothetical protein [Ponticoccus alexandrii]QRF66433.1 hypothetical protein GQA70_08980 [Ponticoccus alexandrii]